MTQPVLGLTAEGEISLYALDTTMLGGQVFYFASAEDFTHSVTWGGQYYTPLPMEVSGFEYTTKGTIPQPMVTLSNLYGAGNTLLREYNGLIGATLTRTLTLARFLDGGATPDPNAYISRDTYVVAQKTSHTALAIIFKLASKMDQEGSQIPRRKILRDICSHTYRVWNAGTNSFDYANASCPYSEAAMFTSQDVSTTLPAKDQCSRMNSGCVARYGTLPLPARFFPGVGRVK